MIFVCDFFVISREVYEKKSVICPLTNVTLVLKHLTKLEEKDGNKSKNMDLPFNQLLDRLSLLERENQSLQVENEKLKIENLKLKESKIGKDFIK